MPSLKFIVNSALLAFAAAAMPGLSGAAAVTFFGNDPNAGGVIPANSNAARARSQFTSNLTTGTVKSESFETIPVGASPATGLFSGTASVTTTGALGMGRIENQAFSGGVATGRFNTSPLPSPIPVGSGRWWESSASFDLIFTTETQGLGFYGTDFGDFEGGLTLSFFRGTVAVDLNVVVVAQPPPTSNGGGIPDSNGSLLFFGYINDLFFDRVMFTVGQGTPNNPGSFDVLGFDDLIIGQSNREPGPTPVPEPGTLALVALSLGLLALRRRK